MKDDRKHTADSPMDPTPRPRRDIVVPAADGLLLRGTLFRPAKHPEEIRGVITIHPNAGITGDAYADMARHLADKGYAVVTYANRGTGRSGLEADTRNEDIRMSDWITLDVPGVLEWARETFPGLPAYAIGHGVGGHGVLWAGSEGTVDAAVLVGCGQRNIGNVPGWLNKAKTFALFTVICPVTATLFGRIPRQPLGFVEEPPVGVVRQWASWTRRRDYFFGDPEFDFGARYARANGRYLLVRVPGDAWCAAEGTDTLVKRLYAAEVEQRQLTPASGAALGHRGLAHAGNEATWDELLTWLAGDAAAAE